MNDKLKKSVQDNKTPGLNNPETYVLKNNRFKTYTVLLSKGLNKAQFFKMSYRKS